MRGTVRLWVARLLIGLVAGWNVQAALAFILWPDRYAHGFELTGVPGAAAVRGTGILFLMWNVPYLAALWQPRTYRLLVVLAMIMQFIGLAGESFILFTLSPGYAMLRASISRFIAFDVAGLVFLIFAFWLSNDNIDGNQIW